MTLGLRKRFVTNQQQAYASVLNGKVLVRCVVVAIRPNDVQPGSLRRWRRLVMPYSFIAENQENGSKWGGWNCFRWSPEGQNENSEQDELKLNSCWAKP